MWKGLRAKWGAKPGASEFEAARLRMVDRQLRARDITDLRVLEAFRKVPRHCFGAEALTPERAYGDYPLPIGCGQTISQPYVVAVMLQALELGRKDRTLEIGTGSGYQTALLAELVEEVCTIEFHGELGRGAERALGDLGYDDVAFHVGDGAAGWPHGGRGFDAIVASAAPLSVPPRLIEQLEPGGRMILPVGGPRQRLVHLRKTADGIEQVPPDLPVRFVPMQSAG